MKRKPHIVSGRSSSGRRYWYAKSRPEARRTYAGLSPSSALRRLNTNRRRPLPDHSPSPRR